MGDVVADTAQRAERPAAAAPAAGQISIIATPRRLYAKGGSDRLKPDQTVKLVAASTSQGLTGKTTLPQPVQRLRWGHVTCVASVCVCVCVRLLCEVSWDEGETRRGIRHPAWPAPRS